MNLQEGLILYIILAASIALHEYGHAKVADLLGDPLPRSQGRVTLNPLAHLDPIGTGLIPLVMIFLSPGVSLIGWGKPVQISLPYPKTRVRDDILITAAGPAVNLLIALVASIVVGFIFRSSMEEGENIYPLFHSIISVNCALIAFNLIPIPPLDGSHFLRHLIGMSEETFYRFSANGWWVLLLLVNLPPFRTFMGYIFHLVFDPFFSLIRLIGNF